MIQKVSVLSGKQRHRSTRVAVLLHSSFVFHFNCCLPSQAFCRNKLPLWASMGNGLVSFDVFRSLCHLSYFPSYLFVLLGEPSRFPGDGNHSPDLRGHLWTHICNGWEPRISHKGWSALPHSSVVVASAESYSVRKIKMLRRWWRRWDGPNIRLSFFWSIKVPKFPSRSHSWGCWEQQQQRWSRSCI